MMNRIQVTGNGLVTFDIKTDREGLCVVVQNNGRLKKKTYVLSYQDALVERGRFINQHWGYRLN